MKGEKLNPYKIGAAAIAGGVTGAIAGPIGDAAELGVVVKVGGQLAANLMGGAVERKLNGEKVLDPKAAVADAAGAAASGKLEKGLEKQLASEVVKKVSGAAIDVTVDAGKNLLTDKPEEHKQEAPKDKKTPGSNLGVFRNGGDQWRRCEENQSSELAVWCCCSAVACPEWLARSGSAQVDRS
jgi:hypothetical protein